MKTEPREKQIQDKIVAYLKTLDHCWYYVTTGNLRGRAGVPDILVCYRSGFIGLEVKRPSGKPTELQLREIKKITDANGLASIVRSVDDVKEIIETQDQIWVE
jgi:hypothetical protein